MSTRVPPGRASAVVGPSGADAREPTLRASWTAIDPTPPAAPRISTVCPVVSRAWSNSPCHAISGQRQRCRHGVADVVGEG